MQNIFQKTAQTIQKYIMFNPELPVPVGFSGGKDSAATIFILNELGYDVRPVIIERGDDKLFVSKRIAENIKKKVITQISLK
jgi:tRNA(Ile)-lysidine synthase TilS/MesJ